MSTALRPMAGTERGETGWYHLGNKVCKMESVPASDGSGSSVLRMTGVPMSRDLWEKKQHQVQIGMAHEHLLRAQEEVWRVRTRQRVLKLALQRINGSDGGARARDGIAASPTDDLDLDLASQEFVERDVEKAVTAGTRLSRATPTGRAPMPCRVPPPSCQAWRARCPCPRRS